MSEGIIASIPVGMVIFSALILFMLGVSMGWVIRRKQEPQKKDDFPRCFALLNAIPKAALIVDGEANILMQNIRALQMMESWESSLPKNLIEAVKRVGQTGLTEQMEIVMAKKKFQVLAAPLHVTNEAQALILITDFADGSYRAELYRQLVGTIAHELRTPLTAILGHVDILNSCDVHEETLWRRSLGFVAKETDRLARLVEDLLSLSRLERVPLHLQPINLRVVAEEAVSELFDFAEKNNVLLIIQSPPDMPRAMADSERLRQVFLNLIDNAIKHASNHPVTICLTPAGETISVEVNNRGAPIAHEDLPRLFEPFWRGKQKSTKGTGLGLTIVRAILEQHHASVGVRSNAEEGTTFYFSLPIAST